MQQNGRSCQGEGREWVRSDRGFTPSQVILALPQGGGMTPRRNICGTGVHGPWQDSRPLYPSSDRRSPLRRQGFWPTTCHRRYVISCQGDCTRVPHIMRRGVGDANVRSIQVETRDCRRWSPSSACLLTRPTHVTSPLLQKGPMSWTGVRPYLSVFDQRVSH